MFNEHKQISIENSNMCKFNAKKIFKKNGFVHIINNYLNQFHSAKKKIVMSFFDYSM